MKVDKAAIYEASKKLSNWGRWGKDDQIGTLNNVTPQDVIDAGRLIKRGKVFSLGLSLKKTLQTNRQPGNAADRDAGHAERQPAGPVSAMIGPNSSQRSPLNFIICICLLMR